jgi:hypothetical protein
VGWGGVGCGVVGLVGWSGAGSGGATFGVE